MATGYPTRQGGRQSFADIGTEAVQTTTGASGESRGAQRVGGESISGVEGGQYSQPGYVAGELGQFFEQFMAPDIARKQQAQFFKGMTEAQSGRALDELTDDSPLTKMFGPSGFAQGAQYYTGQTAINNWQQAQLADMDTLRQLPPEELAKHFSTSIEDHLTGDPYADQIVQAGYMEAIAPLTQMHAKARYGWMQSEARRTASENANSAAVSLQQIATTNWQLGEEADTEAVKMSARRFVGSMSKPEGMADETYRDFMYDFMRKSMADGNFYAVSVMRSQGVNQIFDDEQQRKLEDDYDKYGQKALEAAVSHPAMMQELLKLDAQIEQVKMGGDEAVTTQEMVQLYGAFNMRLKQMTGVDEDYFDVDDVLSKGGEIHAAFTSRFLRMQSRADTLADREYDRETRLRERQAEADAEVAAATTAWTTGQINAWQATGKGTGALDTVAFNEFTNGQYDNIANAYTGASYVSQPVKRQIAALSRAGIGSEHTKATEQAYQLWQKFNDINPDLADAYFEEYDQGFEVYDQLVGTLGTEAAYREAFGTGRVQKGRLYGEQAKQFKSEFDEIIDDTSSGMMPWNWNNHTLNEQGAEALRRTIYGSVAGRAGNSNRPTATLVRQGYNAAIREGRFEQYGVFGWANSKGTEPLSKALGLQGDDAHSAVSGAILQRLQRIGVEDTDGVDVIRTKSGLALSYDDGEGNPVRTIITMSELHVAARNYIAGKRRRTTVSTNQRRNGL